MQRRILRNRNFSSSSSSSGVSGSGSGIGSSCYNTEFCFSKLLNL
jgi:hypothetical protein